MASPQLEDGFTKIANEILDSLAKTEIKLGHYEWKILMMIFRKTYGWGKKEDTISISQFVEGTGIQKQHVCRSIKRLVKAKIVTQLGYGYYSRYSFQKDYESWKLLPKRVTLPNGVTNCNPTGLNCNPTGDIQKKLYKRKKYSVVFTKPEITEIELYMKDKEEAVKFYDHFQSNGWLVGGRAKMKDWKAACRNWMRNKAKFTTTVQDKKWDL
jgi:phage replication O-like protein O